MNNCIDCKKLINRKAKRCNHCNLLFRYKTTNIAKTISKTLINKHLITKKKITCKVCGQEKCTIKSICKRYRLFPTLSKYFGFNLKLIGSVKIYSEFERIRNILIKDYVNKELSLEEVSKKYKHNNIRNFSKILNSLDIKRRSLSQGGVFSYKNFKHKLRKPYKCYKSGYHNTWMKTKVFYRSGYELKYCKYLDKRKINYEMETLRILYFDNQLQKERVSIPDFYLKDYNTIVEIKGKYTYNEQNIKDRFKEYKKLGYDFKLLYGSDLKDITEDFMLNKFIPF